MTLNWKRRPVAKPQENKDTMLITEADHHQGSGTIRAAQSITTALHRLLLCGGGRKENKYEY